MPPSVAVVAVTFADVGVSTVGMVGGATVICTTALVLVPFGLSQTVGESVRRRAIFGINAALIYPGLGV